MTKIKRLFPVSDGTSILSFMLTIAVAAFMIIKGDYGTLSTVVLVLSSIFTGLSLGIDYAVYVVLKKLEKNGIELKII